MSNLKTLGSLMMFPGTMTRPPPPFTSTITRLSSRSLSCQVVRCKWYFPFKPVDIVWFADPTSVPCFRDEVVVKNFLNILWNQAFNNGQWQYLEVKGGFEIAAKGLGVSFPTVCLNEGGRVESRLLLLWCFTCSNRSSGQKFASNLGDIGTWKRKV